MVKFKRWINDSGLVKAIDFDLAIPEVNYDDVVDRSTFRPDSESVRQSVLSGSGFGAQGVYDDPDIPPSDLEVSIRSGKLDKAEVGQILAKKTEAAKKTIDENRKKAIADEKERIVEARQEFLDKATGFKGAVPES